MKIYVAGPMRGIPLYNFPAFDEATTDLRAEGHEVINPAEIDRELGFDPETGTDDDFEKLGGMEAAMSRDFAAILECDGIALLPGWERSTGARAEVFIAETTGRKVYRYHDIREPVPLTPLEDTGVTLPEPKDRPEYVPGEVRMVNAETGGEKGSKLARFDLIPAGPLSDLAEHYGRGARKYEDRNWERGYEWSLSFAALNRHLWAFWQGEDLDPETGSHHMAAVAWHAFTLLEFARTCPNLDNRPGSGLAV